LCGSSLRGVRISSGPICIDGSHPFRLVPPFRESEWVNARNRPAADVRVRVDATFETDGIRLKIPAGIRVIVTEVVVDEPSIKCSDVETRPLRRRSLLDSHIFPGRELLEDVTCYRWALDNELIGSTPMRADGMLSAHREDVLINIVSVKFTFSGANRDSPDERCGRPAVVRKNSGHVSLVRRHSL
jgi:hypothetical protein